MVNVLTNIEVMVKKIDPVNAEYILADNQVISKIESAERFAAKGDTRIVEMLIEDIEKIAEAYDSKNITPANAKVGDGVTIHLYSDAHAATVVKVTKTTVTVQRDIATRDPEWKPEFVVGGFAGHCTNQREQTYTYEQNPNGSLTTFRWSTKYNRFRKSKTGTSLTKGRREFYDYNF